MSVDLAIETPLVIYCGKNAVALVKIVGTLITAGPPASTARCNAGRISFGCVTSSP